MTAYDSDNIFAKILRGEIPSHKVLETEDVLAIMDVMPQADGHALVLPKNPCRNLLDASPTIFGSLFSAVQQVATAGKTAFKADGVLIQQFNEAPAGQSVFHLHVHVIPRHTGVPLRAHSGEMADHTFLATQAQAYRAALG
ncbi:MAG: HIT family protein [Hyphomicrobiales bacterium]|jgi:histidine triad (HIT) family protein